MSVAANQPASGRAPKRSWPTRPSVGQTKIRARRTETRAVSRRAVLPEHFNESFRPGAGGPSSLNGLRVATASGGARAGSRCRNWRGNWSGLGGGPGTGAIVEWVRPGWEGTLFASRKTGRGVIPEKAPFAPALRPCATRAEPGWCPAKIVPPPPSPASRPPCGTAAPAPALTPPRLFLCSASPPAQNPAPATPGTAAAITLAAPAPSPNHASPPARLSSR